MVPPQRRARLLLRAVPDARRQPLVLALADRDARRYIRQLLRLVFLRLDVRELEQLHVVQLPLRFAHLAPREEVAFLVGELPADDVFADRFLAFDFNRAEVRQHARRRRERDVHLVAAGALLRDVHLGVRIAVVAQEVERALARRHGELPIERLVRLQRQAVAQRALLPRRQHVEPRQVDPGDQRRLPFRDADDDVDLVLLVIELDVERADARVGIPAVAIERLDAFEVGLERAPIEVGLVAPGQLGAAPGLERRGQRLRVDSLDALEVEAVDLDVLLPASAEKDGKEKD